MVAYLRRSARAAPLAEILTAIRCGRFLGARVMDTLVKSGRVIWIGKGTPARYAVFPKIPSAHSYRHQTEDP
jgi:hypothetical protein